LVRRFAVVFVDWDCVGAVFEYLDYAAAVFVNLDCATATADLSFKLPLSRPDSVVVFFAWDSAWVLTRVLAFSGPYVGNSIGRPLLRQDQVTDSCFIWIGSKIESPSSCRLAQSVFESGSTVSVSSAPLDRLARNDLDRLIFSWLGRSVLHS
jgi:hypothetical protein